MKRVLTAEMEKYFIENCMKESKKSMAKKFGVSDNVVANAYKKNSIVVPREVWMRFKSENMTGRTTLTPEQDKVLKDHYLEIPVKQLASVIGKSATAVKCRMRQLGLVIPLEIIDKRKCESRYSKGRIPENKGKKQSEYMTEEAIERTRGTRFKKGNIPQNAYEHDGVVTIRTDHKDRTGRQYKWIRIKLGKWMPLHSYNWISANGPIPKKHVLAFKDGDSLNPELENLELITMAENMGRNSYITNYPKDVQDLIRLKGAINRQINKKKKS